MKNKLKHFLRHRFPVLLFWFQSVRFRRQCRRMFFDFQSDIARTLYDDHAICILAGPFQGLRYFNRVVWGPITPKWLGSYEACLHGLIEQIKGANYPTIIDIGAAEGYYAVGLAKACPESSVLTFDIDPFARQLQRELALLNGVENIKVCGECNHETLSRILNLRERALLICDIEGWEAELLNPSFCPALSKADILVEIHDFEGFSALDVCLNLETRFKQTHVIRRLDEEAVDLPGWRAIGSRSLERLDDRKLRQSLDEHRGTKQTWLWLTAQNPE